MSGNSFGSFFSTIAASAEPRLAAVAVTATNLEPGAHTIFESASPTFKTRFMWMSNFDDEAAFDEFRKTITWEGSAEKIKMPYLAMAGEADELLPAALHRGDVQDHEWPAAVGGLSGLPPFACQRAVGRAWAPSAGLRRQLDGGALRRQAAARVRALVRRRHRPRRQDADVTAPEALYPPLVSGFAKWNYST